MWEQLSPKTPSVVRKRAGNELLASTGRNPGLLRAKYSLIYFESSKNPFRVPQKQTSGGTVGIPVKYLSGELLTGKIESGARVCPQFDGLGQDFRTGRSEVDNSCLASGKEGYNCNYF